MENLWSPWRMKYVTDNEKPGTCIFCNYPSMQDGETNLIVHRGVTAFAILNRYPYTSGHLMIVPFAHVASIEELPGETRSEIMELVNQSIGILRKVYQPGGFNVGINMGTAAGAGIAEHAHVHVVPRWGGDTNFMSTTGETRVMPEDLKVTYARIVKTWSE
ncbi:MAG: HIT domain-containing protein [Chloroflexi bacterium]|nr:HIT domain-containing protein [Chloroflexota bacterium]